MKLTLTPGAAQELEELYQYYEECQPGLGQSFLDEFEKSLALIVNMPLAWIAISRRSRRCLFHRFPCAIIYSVQAHEVIVLSVMHTRQRPRRW